MKKIIKDTIYVIVMISLAFMLVSVAASRISGSEPQLFGYQFKTVLSGSMEPTFNTGSIILVKKIKGSEIFKTGDVISFKQDRQHVITHRITNVVQQNGKVFYQTKGDNNSFKDRDLVPSNTTIAKYTGITIPFIGFLLKFFSSKAGMALLFILPGLLLLTYSIITIRQAVKEKAKLARRSRKDVANKFGDSWTP
ncbi:signal peptidase I SipW [Neobacillus sp. GCM10023253]|uniref:signal peptidase I SipW n=1 Tax=Neobacillus sp. GCM10023253 TaxID=3252644 RepID=UPI00360F2DDA